MLSTRPPTKMANAWIHNNSITSICKHNLERLPKQYYKQNIATCGDHPTNQEECQGSICERGKAERQTSAHDSER